MVIADFTRLPDNKNINNYKFNILTISRTSPCPFLLRILARVSVSETRPSEKVGMSSYFAKAK